jgi:RNA polymerase sigma factor (sigma-70 family)
VFAAAFNAMLADNRAINVRPWLYRIARNRSLNHLRRATAVGMDSMDVHYADAGQSTGEKVFKRETFRLLMEDVRALPESQRTALLLREMEALSYQEIAEAMETTIPSVKSLLVRARVSLAEATEARRLSCDEVRLELGHVAEGLMRMSAPVRRHVRECDRCTNFRSALKANNRALAAILPLGPMLIMKKLVLAKLGTTAGASSATAAGAGGAAAGTTAMGTAGGGIVSGALATKAVAGLAAAALVTAGAVEVRHAAVAPPHRAAHPVIHRAAAVPVVASDPSVVDEAGLGRSYALAADRRIRRARANRARHRRSRLARAMLNTPVAQSHELPKPAPAKPPVTQQISGTTALPTTPAVTPHAPASTVGPGGPARPSSTPGDGSGTSSSGSGSSPSPSGSGGSGQPSSGSSSGSPPPSSPSSTTSPGSSQTSPGPGPGTTGSAGPQGPPPAAPAPAPPGAGSP